MANELEEWLEKAKTESKTYLFIEALPSYESLKELLENEKYKNYNFNELQPIHLFFAVQISHTIAEKVDANKLTEAYISAIQYLPITWWGMPGGLNTDASQMLLNSDLNYGLFTESIFDASPLRGSESEDNTIAKKLVWQAGDYVYAFSATKHKMKFDLYKEPEERQKAKENFLKKLQLKSGEEE